jgi:hypothetical protein
MTTLDKEDLVKQYPKIFSPSKPTGIFNKSKLINSTEKNIYASETVLQEDRENINNNSDPRTPTQQIAPTNNIATIHEVPKSRKSTEKSQKSKSPNLIAVKNIKSKKCQKGAHKTYNGVNKNVNNALRSYLNLLNENINRYDTPKKKELSEDLLTDNSEHTIDDSQNGSVCNIIDDNNNDKPNEEYSTSNPILIQNEEVISDNVQLECKGPEDVTFSVPIADTSNATQQSDLNNTNRPPSKESKKSKGGCFGFFIKLFHRIFGISEDHPSE